MADDVVSAMILQSKRQMPSVIICVGIKCGSVHIADNAAWHIRQGGLIESVLNIDDYNMVKAILANGHTGVIFMATIAEFVMDNGYVSKEQQKNCNV